MIPSESCKRRETARDMIKHRGDSCVTAENTIGFDEQPLPSFYPNRQMLETGNKFADRETDGAVHCKSMGPKLRHTFQKEGEYTFSHSDWLDHIRKGSKKKLDFNFARTPATFSDVYSRHSRAFWTRVACA